MKELAPLINKPPPNPCCVQEENVTEVFANRKNTFGSLKVLFVLALQCRIVRSCLHKVTTEL